MQHDSITESYNRLKGDDHQVSIYDDKFVQLPVVKVPEYKRKKLKAWLRMFNRTYSTFVNDVIDHILIDSMQSMMEYPLYDRTVKEVAGRLFDEWVKRKDLQRLVEDSLSDSKVDHIKKDKVRDTAHKKKPSNKDFQIESYKDTLANFDDEFESCAKEKGTT